MITSLIPVLIFFLVIIFAIYILWQEWFDLSVGERWFWVIVVLLLLYIISTFF